MTTVQVMSGPREAGSVDDNDAGKTPPRDSQVRKVTFDEPFEDAETMERQKSDLSGEESAERRHLHSVMSASALEVLEVSVLFNESKCAEIANNPHFQNFTLGVISFNALWIGITTQWNHKELKRDDGKLPFDPWDDVVANILCAFYSFEVVVRFLAFKRKCDCARLLGGNDVYLWFAFDTTLVTFMVVETWVVPILESISSDFGELGGFLGNFALLRLARLSRMIRLMRKFPELMCIVKSVWKAFKATGFILILILATMYVFAIVFTSAVAGNKRTREWTTPEPDDPCEGDPVAEDMFEDLGDSMMTLFTNAVLGDNLWLAINAIVQYDDELPIGIKPLHWLFMMFFVFSSTLLLNMLIGVMANVIAESADEESDYRKTRYLEDSLAASFNALDLTGDGLVSNEEWHQMKEDPELRLAFEDTLDIDSMDMEERLVQLEESLFTADSDDDIVFNAEQRKESSKTKRLSFTHFVDKVENLNPATPANALDCELLKLKLYSADKQVRKKLKHIDRVFEAHLAARKSGKVQPHRAKAVAEADVNSDDLLAQLPNEVLFDALKKRAAVSPTSALSTLG